MNQDVLKKKKGEVAQVNMYVLFKFLCTPTGVRYQGRHCDEKQFDILFVLYIPKLRHEGTAQKIFPNQQGPGVGLSPYFWNACKILYNKGHTAVMLRHIMQKWSTEVV